MVVVRRKQVVAGVLGLALLSAGLINYMNQPSTDVSGDITGSISEVSFVSSMVENFEANNPAVTELTDSYFVSARLERDKTYGEQVDTHEDILYNEKSDENMKKIAQEQINMLTNNLNKTMSIETLLKAKGFEDTVAIINDSSINVVVKSLEELNVAQVAQIQNVVMRETNSKPENIHIITKK